MGFLGMNIFMNILKIFLKMGVLYLPEIFLKMESIL